MGPGVVSAGSPATAEAGAALLRAGGNAFDAAVAAGFAATVGEPGYTSLGGGGFLLAHTSSGDDILFDFFVDTPGRGRPPAADLPPLVPVTLRFTAADQVFHCGLASVAVPAVLAGYRHVHARLGRLPLADVVGPAVRLAEHGVVLEPIQARVVALLAPILTLEPAGRTLYSPNGSLPGAGERFGNPELAALLRRVGEGDPTADMLSGPLAEALVGDMVAGGGLVTAEDLAAYRVEERDPLVCSYRGRTLLTNPSPAFGGPLVAAGLQLLEAAGPLPALGTGEHLLALAEAMMAVDATRAALMGTAKGTTHLSVIDGEGNVASMTTSNGEGSGYMLPGTGVMLNNMLGEEDLHPVGFHRAPPGTRVPSMMAPTVLFDGAGRPALALGSGGSERIRTALLQVLTATIDHGLDPVAAVSGPRIHWDGDQVQAEPGFDPMAVAVLAERWPVNVWPAPDLYFGGVHAAAPGRGAGDPRRGGVTIVVE